MCRFKGNRICDASVDAVIMSREAMPRVVLYVLGLFLSRYPTSSYMLAEDCMEFDIEQLDDYLSELNLENVPTVNMMIGEFKCPVTALPFGALKSDWSRLQLLQRAQPDESIFREKLGRLFRILVSAYFRMEERFDVTEAGVETTSSLKVSSIHESTVTVNSIEGRTEQNVPMIGKATNATTESCATPAIVSPNGVSLSERITSNFSDGNATIENRNDNSSRVSDNISTTAIPFSAGGNRTALEKKTVIVSENANSFPVTSTETQIHTNDVSNNYTSTFNEGSLRPNALDATGTRREINSGETFSLQQEVISTTDDLTNGQSIGRNLGELNAGNDDVVAGEISETDHVGTLTEPTVTKADSIATFSTDSDVSGAMTFYNDRKSSTNTKNVVADDRSKRIFVAETTTSVSNSTVDTEDNGSRKTNGRGDYPMSHDFSSFVHSDENEIDKQGELNFSTVQYHPVTERNFAESENTRSNSSEITHTKGTTESIHIYSDKISGDGVATSTEGFSLSNRRTTGVPRVFEKIPRHSPNSTFTGNKIRKPTMYKNTPTDNEFWKFLVRSRTLPISVGKAASTLATEKEGEEGEEEEEEEEEDGSSTKFHVKKRGSLNTDVGKNFRWFYNFVHEDKGHSGNDRVGRHDMYIQCKEKERNDGQ